MLKPAHSLFALVLLASVSVTAQAQPKPAPGAFTYSAPKVVARQNGIRLEGTTQNPARINSPQLNVVAPVIAFDLGKNTISEVRANGGVSLKLNVAASGTAPKTYVEAKSDSAVLTTTNRTLQLVGHLSGFYQIGAGGKNTLSGDRADLSFTGGNFAADVQNPVLQIPAETIGRADALGALEVSAQKGQVNQSTGSATFSGNARAKSTSGPNAFDLSAPTFILSRGADGTLSTLETKGKTDVKYDLPPDPKAASNTNGIGVPTHIEVTADGASFDRATSKATFSGNVRGSYRLQTPSGPQNYAFSGDQAVISFNTQAASTQSGLNVEVTGVPVEINAPGFEF
ncbi:hypothetical protein IAD21_01507 [Abditibacteriota bacterium]|nr:hypothetical protein IAD21_01507 [Abditibacteriota bacterium]